MAKIGIEKKVVASSRTVDDVHVSGILWPNFGARWQLHIILATGMIDTRWQWLWEDLEIVNMLVSRSLGVCRRGVYQWT